MFNKLFLVFFMLITVVEWMMRIQFIERTNEKKPLNSHDTHRYHSFKIFFVYFFVVVVPHSSWSKKFFSILNFITNFFFIAGTFVPMMITLFNYYQEINIHNCSISFLFLFFLLKIKLHHHNDDDNNNDGSMEPKITATAAINDWKKIWNFFSILYNSNFYIFFFKCYSNIFKKNLWCVNLVFFCFIFFLLQIQLKFLWKNFFFLCKYHLCVCLWQCVIVSFMQQFIRNNRFLIKGGCHG